MNPLDYKILSGRTPAELETEVKESIRKGYRPTGGVFVVVDDEKYQWLQAMVELDD
ncbi:MAG TPA: DUF1737 domain-containing protein [Verrucomicrobiae bacterium]|jgi:hypothetical protein|nr:DUF1737 domain-containing protein [Verrucomicrobiae bacterium]